jgi:hypothetical protein
MEGKLEDLEEVFAHFEKVELIEQSSSRSFPVP